jgi:hypothetical protein
VYHLDGKEVEYNKLISRILDALFSGDDVHYAFHHGVDIYWVDSDAPTWADPVRLEQDGLTIRHDKLIEPLGYISSLYTKLHRPLRDILKLPEEWGILIKK